LGSFISLSICTRPLKARASVRTFCTRRIIPEFAIGASRKPPAKEVPAEEIVRGFEVERDFFVVISDDELKEAAPEKSATIEIQEFVNESQIPTLYFEKPYYLEPGKGALI